MISFEYVSFGYDGLNAAIRPGECVLLCGASGCGKTTVTKLINGLIPAFTPGCRLEGRVEVDGLDPAKTPMHQLARKVGSVFQNPKSQFFNLDTDSELAFGLENEGRPPEEIRKRVADTVDALHLQELQARNIFSLSGGQKQLLAFGSVYAMGPEIFVLDEPTANLDQDAIARLHDQIAGLKRQGRTVVIAEHRLYFLTDLIDRALYLRDGVLERTFTREQFCALTDGEREALGLRTAPCGTSRCERRLVRRGLDLRLPKGTCCISRPVLFCPPGGSGGYHRTQWRGQDHPLPVPVRPDPGTGRADRTEWQAAEPKGAAEGGVLRHAGCEPPALLRQRVGRVPDVRTGCA